jgi:hypothetical protein
MRHIKIYLHFDGDEMAHKLVLKFVFINLLEPELFFLILAQPVYKMWIIQEPNKLELWNKLNFEEEKTDSVYHV